MKELTCIVCPMGCSLTVDEGPELTVTGDRCPRGAVYAQEEIRAPKRVVTATCSATCGTDEDTPKRVPVKTSVPCPKERIPELLRDIYQTHIKLPVRVGDMVISNWNDSGIDIVVTRSIS